MPSFAAYSICTRVNETQGASGAFLQPGPDGFISRRIMQMTVLDLCCWIDHSLQRRPSALIGATITRSILTTGPYI